MLSGRVLEIKWYFSSRAASNENHAMPPPKSDHDVEEVFIAFPAQHVTPGDHRSQSLVGTAGFGPWFHLPGFPFGYLFLTHTHVFKTVSGLCSAKR